VTFPAYVAVVLDGGPPKPLDYGVPPELIATVAEGTRVGVPVRGKRRTGTVAKVKSKPAFDKVLPISEVLSDTLPSDLLELATWMSRYYFAPMNTVFRTLLPGVVRRETKPKEQLVVRPKATRESLRATCASLQEKAPAQARALEVLLAQRGEILLTELLEQADTTRSTLTTLEKNGLIALSKIAIDRSPLTDAAYFKSKPKKLNPDQAAALAKINNATGFHTFLLYGVTGSGKTEVYLQAIDKVLAEGKNVIMLVPEIALTGQTVERFRSRFEGQLALLHHRLSDGERADEWQRLRTGRARIAIGPRSAIFSPLPDLGLIIVDEEHEGSYKQSDGSPYYNARDLAVVRGRISGATVILGTATPSLESYTNCTRGKYTLLSLPIRADNAQLPTVRLLPFQKGRGSLLSDDLLTAIEKRFKIGEQTLLFLNRRGYHSMQWCSECKEPLRCPHCDLSLTFHRGPNTLACHLCAYALSPPPTHCPICRSETLAFRGAGTEQVERALHAIFPDLRTLRVDADTTRHKGSHEKLLRQFRTGKADLLIGTQMIAKGLHFPQVTLVGVLNADISLHIPDFRSSERLFQLITQVAGRAGRGQLAGEVLIQTRMPENPTLLQAAAQDYDAFYASEIEVRRAFNYPPFSHLIKITVSGEDAALAQKTAESLHNALNLPDQILPVVPCGYAKIKDRYRFQFLIRGTNVYAINAHLSTLTLPRNPRITIDIDPLSTFF
jgi:primosomal protein N' (replication factor Y) (superfamily II helicase)